MFEKLEERYCELSNEEGAKEFGILFNGIIDAFENNDAEWAMYLSGRVYGALIDGNEDMFNHFIGGIMDEADLKELNCKRTKIDVGTTYVESEYKYYHDEDEVLSISEFKKS